MTELRQGALHSRVVTALVLVSILIAALFGLPPLYWSIFMLLVLTLSAHEWAKLAGMHQGMGLLFVAGALAIAGKLLLVPSVGLGRGWPSELVLTIGGASLAFWALGAPLWLAFGWHARSKLALALAGWLVLVPAWFAIGQLQSYSPAMCFALMGIVWVADIAAYFAGRRYGRHKLAPTISPGKTWEGVYGGFAAVVLYALVLAALAPLLGYTGTRDAARIGVWLLAALGLAVLSVLGDLFESWLKRVHGVKDSGALLPGHGGMLDRVDAMLAAMPAAAVFAQVCLVNP
jgi:phosphatidate cytidylyltransferase